jgi:hypothetical protein
MIVDRVLVHCIGCGGGPILTTARLCRDCERMWRADQIARGNLVPDATDSEQTLKVAAMLKAGAK